MPNYTKQTWLNNLGGGTPLAAARMNHMEDGIAAASVNEVLVLNVGQTVPVNTPTNTLVVRKLI